MGFEKGKCSLCGRETTVRTIFSPYAVKDMISICHRCLGPCKNNDIDLALSKFICDFRGVHHPCTVCRGMGVILYPSTSKWRGGIGGSAITRGICDHCWGSGDEYDHWIDVRKALTGK